MNPLWMRTICIAVIMTLSCGCPEIYGKSAPSHLATYHYSLGVLQMLDENPGEAVKEFEKALHHDPTAPDIAAELAAAYVEKGESSKAIAVCERALKVNPDHVGLNLMLGGLYMNAKNYPRAITHYQTVIRQDAKNVSAFFYLGIVYGESRHYPEAIGMFEKVLLLDSHHLMAAYYQAKIYMDMKNYEGAERMLKKTLSIGPNFESALIDLALVYEKQQKTAMAIDAFRDYLSLHPEKISVRTKLGEMYIREKRYDEAEKEFYKILRLDPENREVLLALGLLYINSGRNDQAIEALEKLTKKYPADYRYSYLQATAYEEKKAYAQAIVILIKIPANSDLYGTAQIRLAMILKKEGKTREAIANLEKAVKVKREVPGLYVILSSLYEEEKDIPGAERILKEGMLLLPQNVDLYYSLGVLYEKTNRFEESIHQMRTLLKIDPDHADALNFIGYSYADRGINLGEAEKMIQKALQLKPGNGYMIDSLGWTYFKQNRIDLAIQYLKEAASLLPNDGTVAEHLGDAYLKAGRSQEALESYQRALKLNPASGSLPKKIDDLPKK